MRVGAAEQRGIGRRVHEFHKRYTAYLAGGMDKDEASKLAKAEVFALRITGAKRLPKRLTDLGIE